MIKFFSAIFHYFNPRRVFIFLGFALIFFVALRPPTDPDMGWHLADGKYLAENNLQVAKSDLFSHSMPDFPVVMHEWVMDWLMFLVYDKAGLFFLSIIFALITSGAFILVAMGMKAEFEHKIVAAIMGVIASVPILGVRPQIISLFGLAFVIYIVYEFRANPQTKKIFFLPLVFLAWVNFHGGFPIGLFLLALFVFFEAIKYFFYRQSKQKRAVRFSQWLEKYLQEGKISGQALGRFAGISLFSFFLTFVNPYGWRVYVEVFTTVLDSYAKKNIAEWLPVSFSNPMSFQFVIYLILLAILLFSGFKKSSHLYVFIAIIFLYLAFSSWRHVPIFLIISIPLWVEIVNRIAGNELTKLTHNSWFLLIMFMLVFFVAKQQLGIVYGISTSQEHLAKAGNYPLEAVKYLKEHPIEGKMLNEYNWGGFLIWQYPEKKVYIDGRMPSWELSGYRAFEEFIQIMRFEAGWEEAVSRREMTFALVQDNMINRVVFSGSGWKETYADGLAAIYVRP